MERRKVLAGLAAVPLLGIGKGRPGMSDVNELAGELERIETASSTEPPRELVQAVESVYARATEALDTGRGRTAREAGRMAGRLGVLAGVASFGLNDYVAAGSWFIRARRHALHSRDVDTMAWVYARESGAAYYFTGYPIDVGGLIERGLAFLPNAYRDRHPAASLLLLRYAECCARDGHDYEARLAVDAAEGIDPGPDGSQLHLGPSEQARRAARVFTELGDVNEADARHRELAGRHQNTLGRTLLALDRARCLVRAGQIDAAAVSGFDAWTRLSPELRTVSARYAARKLAFDLRPRRAQPHVDTYLSTVSGV